MLRLFVPHVLLLAVRLERKDDVEENEEREDERLNEADEKLEPDERKHQARNEEQRREHREHDLAAPDVAPKTKGEREDPEELREELDDPDDDHHAADENTLAERREVEPAREVGEAVLADAGCLVPDEPGQGHRQIGVVVGGRHVQKLDLADEGDHEKPVAEEREEEERPEEREVADDAIATCLTHEIAERLDHELEQVLKTAWPFAQARRRRQRDQE